MPKSLLTGDAGVEVVFAKLAPALELDAFAAYTAASGDGLTLETAAGLSATAISSTAVAAIIGELEPTGRRTLVLESLRDSADSRAAVFRELGFASAVVGALVAGRPRARRRRARVRGRSERFGSAELTIIDTVISYLAAAYERRDLERHRHNAERREREFLTVLAHELRNPLAPVRNALEIIRANDRTRSPVEHSAYAMIERQLQQISRLADDLLDADQVVLGQVELAKQPRVARCRRRARRRTVAPVDRGGAAQLGARSAARKRLRSTPIRSAWRAPSPISSTMLRDAWTAAAES